MVKHRESVSYLQTTYGILVLFFNQLNTKESKVVEEKHQVQDYRWVSYGNYNSGD